MIESSDALHRVGVYKAAAPEATIARIRALLQYCGLFVIERQWQLRPGHWASVQLQIPGSGFSVNGKGIDPKFALASAYGELMERLQFLNEIGLAYPDQQWLAETQLSPAALAAWPTELLARLASYGPMFGAAGDSSAEAGTGLACVPFFHVNRGEPCALPIDALRQHALTNGTCAGNTPHEALIHGICEILERFVLRRIVDEQPLLPSIPLADLRQFQVFASLSDLQRQGIDVLVKDCSFGGTWPVVGIVLRQGERGLFHLGASPSFPLALERCLTEIFQGVSLERLIARLPLLPMAPPASKEQAALRFVRAAKNIERLVEPCLLESASDYAAGFVHRSAPDMVSPATLNALVQRIMAEGHELFVRDIGFLGFPSFTIFIPGMSTLQDERYHWQAQTAEREDLAAIYLRLDQASPAERRRLAEAIQRWLRSSVRYAWQSMQQSLLGLDHGPEMFRHSLEPVLAAALLFDEAGEPHMASALLQAAQADLIATEEFDATRAKQLPARVRFGAYLASRAQGVAADAARQAAFAGNLDPVSAFLAQRLARRISLAQALGVPQGCYRCADCALAANCEVPGRQELGRQLAARMRDYSFDQRWLATLFA